MYDAEMYSKGGAWSMIKGREVGACTGCLGDRSREMNERREKNVWLRGRESTEMQRKSGQCDREAAKWSPWKQAKSNPSGDKGKARTKTNPNSHQTDPRQTRCHRSATSRVAFRN
jgi:hypothetical protein